MLRTISDLFPNRVPAVAYGQALFSGVRSVPGCSTIRGILLIPWKARLMTALT